tara:strand:- start:9365 stop:12343 length:2979 start_codon:yes stop_codon:yes gene_type:complete
MKKELFIVIFLFLTMNFTLALEIDPEVEKQLNNNPEVQVIIKLKEEDNNAVKIAMKQEVLSSLDEEEFEKKNEYSTINAISGQLNQEGLDRLKQDSNIERIEFNYPVKSLLQDSINLVNATLVHPLSFNSLNITGRGQTICVIDTGINHTHPALDGKVLDGHCYQNDNSAFSSVLCNSGGSEEAGIDGAIDDNGHGTHVSGIAAGNNTIIGVAPGANLISIKALNASGDGLSGDIIRGIDWCTSNSTVYNISVISMSLGGGSFSSTCDSSQTAYRDSINSAIAKNITVVVSTGNSGSTTSISAPACITNSTSVSASTKSDGIASFSDRNSITDLFAPGFNINSTVPGDGCALCDSSLSNIFNGTSMAAPHVSGAIAILKQLNSTIFPSEMESLLNKTGRLLDDTSGSGFFFNIIDMFNASMTLNDLVNPILTLDVGDNNFVNEVNFNFTVEDHTITNCNLYTNSTGTFELNTTTTLENDGSYNISVENLDDGSYDWNVECSDSNNNNVFADNNFTINIDTTVPTINYNITLTTVELGIENTTIGWTSLDTNLDDTFVNITYSNGSLFNKFTENTTLTTNNITEVGNYTVLFYANDSANNINTTSVVIEFVEIFPDITLVEPRNITYSFNNSIDLNFSIDNNYTDIWYNLDEGTNITITENITFNTSEGVHILYLSSNNTLNRESSTSKSFVVDLTDPIVDLLSPSNNTLATDNDVTFSYNVTDFSIANCSLYLDNSIDQTNSSVEVATSQSFSNNDMSNADYDWFVSCTDYSNLQGNSTIFKLTVNETSSGGISGGGSGGGGGGSGEGSDGSSIQTNDVETQTVRETKDFEVNFKSVDEDSFNVAKDDSVKFSIKEEDHIVIVDAITSDSVTMTISSDPITLTLKIGESKKVDIDDEEGEDLEVTLIDILDDEAFIKFKILESEKIIIEESNQTGTTSSITGSTIRNIGERLTNKYVIISVIILIILGILGHVKRDFVYRKIKEFSYKIKYR